jgi:hypothetical protein
VNGPPLPTSDDHRHTAAQRFWRVAQLLLSCLLIGLAIVTALW